mmetsp:Transcript_18438/g.43062  ORF Transcript_18438/g.43062 Transcript_18438/m.43062 type:complete len:206 (+) Transcript_18438:481-1098(+)
MRDTMRCTKFCCVWVPVILLFRLEFKAPNMLSMTYIGPHALEGELSLPCSRLKKSKLLSPASVQGTSRLLTTRSSPSLSRSHTTSSIGLQGVHVWKFSKARLTSSLRFTEAERRIPADLGNGQPRLDSSESSSPPEIELPSLLELSLWLPDSKSPPLGWSEMRWSALEVPSGFKSSSSDWSLLLEMRASSLAWLLGSELLPSPSS